jgi:DNA-binding transcriptional LysR family regulator
MNWDDYDVFCYVVEHRGISAAARAVERPKSSISAAISRLEASLSVRLLERTTRRVVLTEPGEALYQSIGILFSGLRASRADALAQGNIVAGTLRLGGPHEFCTFQLGPVACDMMERFPQLKIRIEVEDDTIDPVEHHYDIVFTRLDGKLPLPTLVQRRVLFLEQSLFASPKLLQRHGNPINLQDLASLPLLCSPHDREWAFTTPDGANENLPTFAPRLSCSNSELRREAALAGLGVARFPSFFGAAAVLSGTLRRVLTDYSCAPLIVYALFPAKRLLPAKVRLFLDALEVHVSQFS